MPRYFVSYSSKHANGTIGFGNCSINPRGPIQSNADWPLSTA